MAIRENNERLERLILGQEELVNTVKGWLHEEEAQDGIVRAVILSSKKDHCNDLRSVDRSRVFSEEDIRRMCVKYRLRFLHGGYFKGQLPLQAVHAVREVERNSGKTLHGFKILAPAKVFRICDSNSDPLLFVQIAPKRYYLIHRWGGELSWWRAVINWPMQGPAQLGMTLAASALLISMVVPSSVIAPGVASWWGAYRLLFLFWTCSVIASATVFAWFAFFGQFSGQAWNSRHFN